MHDRLRTLDPEKKKKWTRFLSEIVYVYNATPHATKGIFPYYFLYGRESRFPVDHLLGADFENSDD